MIPDERNGPVGRRRLGTCCGAYIHQSQSVEAAAPGAILLSGNRVYLSNEWSIRDRLLGFDENAVERDIW